MKHGMILTAAILLTSSLSFARGGDFGVGNGGDGLQMEFGGHATTLSAPVKVPSGGKANNYSEFKKIWDNGQKMTQGVFVGTWRNTAYATSEACGGASEYNPKGIVQSDYYIRFLKFKLVSADSFFHKSSPILSVDLLAQEAFNGGKTIDLQGAHKVDSVEPQFAIYTSNYDTEKQKRSYVEYSCRTVSGNSNKMICALNYNFLPEEISSVAKEDRDWFAKCYGSGISHFFLGFEKEQASAK